MAVWRKATSPCTNAVATNLLGSFNSLRPRLNRRPLTDDIFKCIFFNENVWISIKISLKFVPKGPINNVPALVQIMAWRRPADKPLSEPVIVSLLTHICVTRPQWVKVTLGSHLLLFFYKNSNSMENSFRCNSILGYDITTIFHKCDDSKSVVPCTNICSDPFINTLISAN